MQGNFLIYRELERGFPPGQKKRAVKRKRSDSPEVKNEEISCQNNQTYDPTKQFESDLSRKLVGSLVENYDFKTPGLCKKTISLLHNKVCDVYWETLPAAADVFAGDAPRDLLL